jgi:hypothetical protein
MRLLEGNLRSRHGDGQILAISQMRPDEDYPSPKRGARYSGSLKNSSPKKEHDAYHTK